MAIAGAIASTAGPRAVPFEILHVGEEEEDCDGQAKTEENE